MTTTQTTTPGIMLFCFTCGRMRIFKDNGKNICPVCHHKKVRG